MNSPQKDPQRALLADPSTAEWQLDALFRNDAVGIFILSLENHYLRVSPRWCSMLGYEEEELLSTDPATVTHPEDLEATALAGTRMFEGDTNSYRMEKRYLRKDGSWFPAEVTVGALRDGSGRLQGAIAVVADVTERHEALSRLRESKARYRGLVENVRDAVWRMDLEGRLTFVTPRCLELTGYRPDELVGTLAQDLVADVDRERAEIWIASLGSPSSPSIELTHRRKDGSEFLGEVRIAQIRGEDGAIAEVQGVTRDVTEERAAARRLREATENERRFRSRLIALHDMIVALSSAPSTEELCRRAVEFGHGTLGFARLSIWFLDAQGQEIRGSFGIDEAGRVRDERGIRLPVPEDGLIRTMEREHGRWIMTGPGPLRDHRGDVVGEGWILSAPLWDGERVVGIAFSDTHGSEQPYTDQDGELLVLFSAAVGHLHTRLGFEEEIRASERRYRAVVNDQTEYIARCSPEGIVTFANPAFARLVDAPTGAVVGRRLRDLGFERLWRGLAVASAGVPGRPEVSAFESEWPCAACEPRWIRWSRRALLASDGEVTEYQLVGVDLTTQRQMDAELRVRQNAIESALHGIAILDPTGCLAYVNRAYLNLFGYDAPEELLGRPISDLCRPTAAVDALVAALHREGTWAGELRGVRRDDEEFDARVSASLTREPDGRPLSILTWVEDVTEAKRVREEQERLSAHLRQVQQAETLGVLAGGVAHDLNNIMMGVIGSAQLSLAHLPTGSDSRHLIEQVESAAWRAANLARQMLAFAGRGRISSENVDLSALVRGMGGLLSSSVSKKTRLDYRLAEPLPSTVADPVQLEQVVMNLVLNAAESLRNGGGSITVTTEAHRVGARAQADRFLPAQPRPGEYVMLRVEDTGSGMDEDTLGRIFDPFYTTKCTGRGLGLAAVMGIVRSHGGAIAVRSSPGEGACFTILLPVGVKAVTAEPLVECHATPAPPARRPAVVLVADDDEVVRRNARTALEMAGHTTLIAEDGLGAIDVFRRHQRDVDVLLLDMMMPGLGGDEVCATVRGLRPGVPVILCSGYDEGVVETSAALDGADRVTFLHKPYSLAELTECVDRCLAQ